MITVASLLKDIEDLRKNFDVSGYGTNEKWIEKSILRGDYFKSKNLQPLL